MSIKNNYLIYLTSISLLLLFTLNISVAQNIPSRPVPPRLVNDLADILTSDEETALERKLVRFNDTTSNQIAIVTVSSLDGYSPSMFAYEIGEKWKVGQKKFDNGVVILVKPKMSSTDKGEVYIAVGYGLEPAIPDAVTNRIIDIEMIPSFKNGNFYQGLNKGSTVIMDLAAGEITAKGYQKKTGNSKLVGILPFIIIIIVLILVRGSRGRGRSIGHSNSSLWTALMIGSMFGGRSNSGSWGNFTGGGSGFGGGGGFGGFGGGSFGGGGAGGSW